MSDEELERQRREQNRRKLDEYLAKVRKYGRVPTAEDEEAEKEAFESKWEAWKRMFGGYGRVYEIREGAPPPDPNADYKLLGVDANASSAELRRAFLRKAKTAHPDAGGDPEQFRELMAAYERVRKE